MNAIKKMTLTFWRGEEVEKRVIGNGFDNGTLWSMHTMLLDFFHLTHRQIHAWLPIDTAPANHNIYYLTQLQEWELYCSYRN